MPRKRWHTSAQLREFTEELHKQTDRGAGIVAAAVLEDALETTIEQRLLELSADRREKLFGRLAPLSTFSAKIELGFALGLFSNEGRKALDMIRDVRNKFAHEMKIITFDDPGIEALIRKAKPARMSNNSTPRDSFLALFYQSLNLLYLEQSRDIRLKSNVTALL